MLLRISALKKQQKPVWGQSELKPCQRSTRRGIMNRIDRETRLVVAISGIALAVAGLLNDFALLLASFALLLIALMLHRKKNLEIIVSVASFFFGLAICEVFLRLSDITAPKSFLSKGFGYTSNYGLKIIGNEYRGQAGEFPFRLESQDGDIIYDVIYSVGDDGFRKDVPVMPNKIYIYGGSFVYGEGLNDNETLSHYLYADHGLASKNLGFHGWGVHNALFNILAGKGNVRQGVNVVLTSPWHALRSSCKPAWTANHPRFYVQGGEVKQNGKCKEGNKATATLKKIANASYIYRMYQIYRANSHLTNGDIELWLALIQEIHDISMASDATLLIAYIDIREDELKRTSWSNEQILNALQQRSDFIVDVTLADSRELLDSRYVINILDEHPSAAANKERAALIAAEIEKIFD